MCKRERKTRGWNIFSETGALNDYVSSIPLYSGNPFPTFKSMALGSLSSAAMADKQNKLLSTVI